MPAKLGVQRDEFLPKEPQPESCLCEGRTFSPGFGHERCMGTRLAVAVRMCLLLADDVKIEPLNYRQLSRASGVPLHMVPRCVRESVLLYCHLLRNKEPVSFVFKNIGVMTCQDDFLLMRFFCSCIAELESNATVLTLFHTVSGGGLEAAPSDRRWPAWMWQAGPVPFPVLAPRLSPLAKRFPGSLPLQKAWQCSCTASLVCHPAPSEQNKALVFTEEALVESSFLLAREPGLLPVQKSHEKVALASLQQLCVPLQRFWTDDSADFGPASAARGIRVFPR